jgi:AcrR family transcriptional regulator
LQAIIGYVAVSNLPELSLHEPVASPASPARPYRGVSAEDRREARRRRLLDAGLALFGGQGIAGTTIADICAQAGLTKRYFYENYASIEELADAVFSDVIGRLVEAVAPAIAAGGGVDPRPALSVYLRTVLGDRQIARLLAIESRTPALAHRQASFGNHAVDLWFASGAGADSPEQRLRAYAFAGAIDTVVLAWTETQIALSIDEVIDELTEIFHRLTAAP